MQIYRAGTRIGQYEIASRPMMGGMGVVYFALDHGNDGRPIALKTFRPEFLPDRATRDRFLREGSAWIELGSHPHIVRCHKVEYIDPTAFLVLELIAKEQNMPDASLRSWLIPGHPLPLEQTLLFALQIARGMEYATEKIPGFVHRDLKPENILVGADRLPRTNINRLRVTDFGLAKAVGESEITSNLSDAKELKPNQIQFTRGVGTPLYMAPEQWKGEPFGIFTDVYAFGCILYEMLSGQYRAEGKTITELQASHFGGKIRAIPSNLPKELLALVTKCLALNTVHRNGTWNEITDALERSFTANFGKSVLAETESADLSREERMQIGRSYNTIGHAYNDLGKLELAAGYYEKALLIVREADDRHGEGAVLSSIGRAYQGLGDIRRAIDYFEQALLILRATNERRGEASILGSLGVAYRNLGDTRQAINYFEQDLAISREVGDRRGEGAALTNLGNVYGSVGDARKAINYFEQSLVIIREIGDRRGEGHALGNVGEAYRILGDASKAIGYHEQAIVILREIGDRRGEGKELAMMAGAYAGFGDAQRAIDCYEQAVTILREIGDRYTEGYALGNLGVIYKDFGDPRRAIACYEQALAIAREIGYVDGVARHSSGMAKLYAQLGETTQALPLAQEAAQIWSQMGSPYAKPALELVAQLQGGSALPSTQANQVEAALEAFARADDSQAMQEAVERHPMLKDEQFIRTIEQNIKEQTLSELKPALQQRFAWLREITGQRQTGFFDRLFGKKG